jgi:hypothetical protein
MRARSMPTGAQQCLRERFAHDPTLAVQAFPDHVAPPALGSLSALLRAGGGLWAVALVLLCASLPSAVAAVCPIATLRAIIAAPSVTFLPAFPACFGVPHICGNSTCYSFSSDCATCLNAIAAPFVNAGVLDAGTLGSCTAQMIWGTKGIAPDTDQPGLLTKSVALTSAVSTFADRSSMDQCQDAQARGVCAAYLCISDF